MIIFAVTETTIDSSNNNNNNHELLQEVIMQRYNRLTVDKVLVVVEVEHGVFCLIVIATT